MKRLSLRTIVISLICLLLLTAIFTLNDTNNIVLANSKVALSLIIRNRTPVIEAGDTLEIEVFISGDGIPVKNKLSVSWSSLHVIDRDNPGVYVASDNKSVGIDPFGIAIDFGPSHFSYAPESTPPYFGIPQIMSETMSNSIPFLLLKINTTKSAPPGDYDITFVFTYSDNQSIYQDYKTAQFHISSLWERIELRLQIGAVSIALVSLVTGAVFSWLTYRKTRQKH
jgi:hypothetical protein